MLFRSGGHVDISRAAAASTIVLDLKTPGSGMEKRNRWENLDLLRPSDEVKIVVTSRPDYEWAREVLRQKTVRGRPLPDACPALLSPVHGEVDPATLAGWILEDRLPVRLNLQLHRIIWPAATRGV